MNRTDGVQADLYEKVLEHARREIDEASGKIEEIRLTLQLLEARVEAAKSVYEAVAARMNLEDELEGESAVQAYPVAPPPEQAPEPPEEPEIQPQFAAQPPPILEPPEEPVAQTSIEEQPPPPQVPAEVAAQQAATEGPGNGNGGFSMDLIRRHFEQKGGVPADQAPAAPPVEPAPKPSGNSAFPELSEAERKLIEEHMRSRAESERKG